VGAVEIVGIGSSLLVLYYAGGLRVSQEAVLEKAHVPSHVNGSKVAVLLHRLDLES